MAIDREDSLRRAEKLLRQGRLDGAIQEYARLLEDQPNDWNTRNVLGDLYVRANQLDNAIAQFTQIADHFAHEGFLPRAVALYKKVLKIKPADEHALLQSAEISARQGLLAEAKTSLGAIAEQRRRRGDKAGAGEIQIRIATLDPSDLGARLAAARAAAETDDTLGAALRYKELAAELFNRDRDSEAIEALAEAVHLDPTDERARDAVVGAYLQRGQVDEARGFALTGAHFKGIAEALSTLGHESQAIDALFDAVQHDPADNATRARLAKQLMTRGDLERAGRCLLPDAIGDDPRLLMLSAEINLRTGHEDAGREMIRALIERDPRRRDEILALAASLAVANCELAFQCVEIVAEAAIAAKDWNGAAGELREFLRAAGPHVPALIKLVDVCVDGDLDDLLSVAQADLAEAYLAAGRAFEARVIAEDLLARAPTDGACIDRFRRALVMLGEANPDAIIAERVTREAAFPIGDLSEDLAPKPAEGGPAPGKVIPFARSAEPEQARGVTTPPPAVRTGALRPESTLAAAPEDVAGLTVPKPGGGEPGQGEKGEPAAPAAPAASVQPVGLEPIAVRTTEPVTATTVAEKRRRDSEPEEDLDAGDVDVHAIIAEPKTASAASGSVDVHEIDLNQLLTGIEAEKPAAQPAAPDKGAAKPPAQGRGLEDVFDELRHEVVQEQATTTAAQHYKLALTYHDMGMTAECIKALETAARSPRYRFQAAALLARIHRRDGRMHEAIDWFERAAETPASSVEAGRALLYELGQALEDQGEAVRALAVYLELQADAGDYRDVAARVKRLSR